MKGQSEDVCYEATKAIKASYENNEHCTNWVWNRPIWALWNRLQSNTKCNSKVHLPGCV